MPEELAAIHGALTRALVKIGLELGPDHEAFVDAAVALERLEALVSRLQADSNRH